MKLRHLRYFVKIVEAGSFSRAAANIHIAQPALSQQIAELEEKVGATLLLRSARGVRPTPEGETLYREALAILRQMEQLPGIVRSTGGPPEGPVTLGMSSTHAAHYSAPFLRRCRSELPKVSLRLITGDSLLLQSQLVANTLDIALVFDDEALAAFARRPLFRQQLYLMRTQPFPDGVDTVSLQDVAAMPLVMPTRPNVMRARLDQGFAAAGLTPNVVVEANVLSAMVSAVEEGLGAMIIPQAELTDVSGRRALAVAAITPPIHLVASVVTSSVAPLTRAGQAVRTLLADFVAERLRESPPPGTEWIDDEDGA
ncbi:MAG: LysR substrate-binding domain-containing protein [Burkholderiales bacterium]